MATSSSVARSSKYTYRSAGGGSADVNIEYSADLSALTRLEVKITKNGPFLDFFATFLTDFGYFWRQPRRDFHEERFLRRHRLCFDTRSKKRFNLGHPFFKMHVARRRFYNLANKTYFWIARISFWSIPRYVIVSWKCASVRVLTRIIFVVPFLSFLSRLQPNHYFSFNELTNFFFRTKYVSYKMIWNQKENLELE